MYVTVPMTSFFTILSQLSIFHHLVTILPQFTIIRRKLYSNDNLNRAIGEYYNGIKQVIAVTELMNVCLNSVEASFQMIIDACEFSVPALYQLVINLFFCLKSRFCIFVSTNWFKIAISIPNRAFYNEP